MWPLADWKRGWELQARPEVGILKLSIARRRTRKSWTQERELGISETLICAKMLLEGSKKNAEGSCHNWSVRD